MLTVSSGHSAGYLTGAVGAGRENYYTGAVAEGEPPGTWHGLGAVGLGLTGQVDNDVMEALFSDFADPLDPSFADPATRHEAGRLGRAPKRFRSPDEVVAARAEAYSATHAATPSPEQLQAWTLEAERAQPKAVMFYDLTFSVPKSVTVLWAGYSRAATDAAAAGDTARAELMQAQANTVEDAIAAANTVMLDHVEQQVVSRVGRHGGTAGKASTGRWVDVTGITVASFPQHTSRDRDPQLHTHNAVLNRVECPDGQWRAIDGKSLYAAKAGAAAIASAELRTALTRDLGVEWTLREDGNDFEIAGIEQDQMDLLSSRTQTLTDKADRLIRDFEEHHGRGATAWERRCLLQEATLATRPAKSHDGETHAEMLDRADAIMRGQVAGGLTRIADQFTAQTQQAESTDRPAPEWSPEAVIAQAIEACHGDTGRATFSRSELSRRIALALPGELGLTEAGQARDLIERLTDQALAGEDVVQTAGLEVGAVPAEHRLASGQAATLSPDAVRYSARGHVAAEHALLRSAGTRDRLSVPRSEITEWLDGPGAALSPAQREAVTGLASSDAALSVLIGPAGTGKSYTVGRLAEAWSDLTGGRVIGVATADLAAVVLRDDGVPDTANTLAFLTAQDRIAAGRGWDADARWHLTERDVLVVDEASMVDTATLTRLHETADAAGARMVLLGDPQQLGAVGAGGMMRTVADHGAEVYTLGEVRRFTHDWESDASLQLRDGHADVVTEYDRRGRLVEGGTQPRTVAAVARAAAADRLAGRDVVVVAASNALAADISAAVRRHLVDAGVVTENGVILGRDSCTAGVGDVVQARRIDRGLGLTNRENYEVRAVRDDGGLDVVSTRTGELRVMPPAYVAADAALAYAGTVHATQGATVDAGHVVLTPGMAAPAAYVGLTRGRDSNTAWAVTDTGIPGSPVATPRGRLASIAAGSNGSGDLSAHDVALADEQWRSSAETVLALAEDHARLACRARMDGDLDQLAADGVLSEAHRARFGADQGSEHLARQLRALEQAGHNPADVLRQAVQDKPLDRAASVAQIVSGRIDKSYGLPVPLLDAGQPERVTPADDGYLRELAQLLDDRRAELGAQLAEEPAKWALTCMGPVPDDDAARADWAQRAGVVAAHREATGWTDPREALGRCPGVRTPEKRADWHRAYTAAGMPENRRPEAELPDGRLLARAAAAERVRGAAPAFVDDAMRARHLQAAEAERAATLARSQGANETAARADAGHAEHAAAAERLAQISEERAAYLTLHAETLGAGNAARDELIRRGKGPGTETDRTTAEEWLAAEHDARQADDQHRVITETDVHEDQADTADTAADSQEDGTGSKATTRDGGTHRSQAHANRGTDRDAKARHQPKLSAGASAAEINAAAAHAALIAEELAEVRAQNAAAPDAADDSDDWDRSFTRADTAHATDEATRHADDAGSLDGLG